MSELINGRTPEEIKLGVECCCQKPATVSCKGCPYSDGCMEHPPEIDALAYIERLESERDAALAKVPRWISVEERLPEEVCRCLVITKRHEESSMVNTATYNHMGWWTYGNFGEVTHWMPLPEPPKEGAHE